MASDGGDLLTYYQRYQKLGPRFAMGALLTVDCVFALTVTNSSWMQALEHEVLLPYGLMHRTSILEQRRKHPAGQAAGRAMQHLEAWNGAHLRGCKHALVLSDDAYFLDEIAVRVLPRVDDWLRAQIEYDLLMLGWSGNASLRHTRHEYFYKVGDAVDLSAYIVSAQAAALAQTPQWWHLHDTKDADADLRLDNEETIDAVVQQYQRRNRIYATLPMVAFLRLNDSIDNRSHDRLYIDFGGLTGIQLNLAAVKQSPRE
ncbi:MAG: hypothetical protein SGPRY_006376 [Prymnesium sp.]